MIEGVIGAPGGSFWDLADFIFLCCFLLANTAEEKLISSSLAITGCLVWPQRTFHWFDALRLCSQAHLPLLSSSSYNMTQPCWLASFLGCCALSTSPFRDSWWSCLWNLPQPTTNLVGDYRYSTDILTGALWSGVTATTIYSLLDLTTKLGVFYLPSQLWQ